MIRRLKRGLRLNSVNRAEIRAMDPKYQARFLGRSEREGLAMRALVLRGSTGNTQAV